MFENSFGWMHEAKEKMTTIPRTNIDVGENTVSSTIWLVVAISTASIMKAYTTEAILANANWMLESKTKQQQINAHTGMALYTSTRVESTAKAATFIL